MKLFLCLLFFIGPVEAFSSNGKVRKLTVQADQIATVKTALGIATIIQVPDRPNSLVVGDTEAFKVEYLDQAITIKPLHVGAKSNLYIYTDYRRFNVQLVTGPEPTADYVVYLDVPKNREISKETKPTLTWTRFRNALENDSISLEVTRLGRTRDGVHIIEFKMKSTSRTKIDPKWFWLTQRGNTIPIHRLILSQIDVDSKSTLEGTIQMLKSDISGRGPLRLELRKKKTSYLTLPEVTSWN